MKKSILLVSLAVAALLTSAAQAFTVHKGVPDVSPNPGSDVTVSGTNVLTDQSADGAVAKKAGRFADGAYIVGAHEFTHYTKKSLLT